MCSLGMGVCIWEWVYGDGVYGNGCTEMVYMGMGVWRWCIWEWVYGDGVYGNGCTEMGWVRLWGGVVCFVSF